MENNYHYNQHDYNQYYNGQNHYNQCDVNNQTQQFQQQHLQQQHKENFSWCKKRQEIFFHMFVFSFLPVHHYYFFLINYIVICILQSSKIVGEFTQKNFILSCSTNNDLITNQHSQSSPISQIMAKQGFAFVLQFHLFLMVQVVCIQIFSINNALVLNLKSKSFLCLWTSFIFNFDARLMAYYCKVSLSKMVQSRYVCQATLQK